MRTFEVLMGTALGLVALYLIVTNASGTQLVLQGSGDFFSKTFGTLQGRG